MLKIIIWFVGLVLFPFLVEWFLFITPEISKFSNETWFSFIGSYSGAIITLIVLHLTLKENRKAIAYENNKLRKQYEIEKEINEIKSILDVLMLNKYNFIDLDIIVQEYAKYIQDIYDIQYEVKELQYDYNGKTARDRLFNRIHLIERAHTLQLIVEKQPKIDSKETAKEYFEFICEKTTKLGHIANNNRKEILDLYNLYVKEMKEKEFAL